MWKTDFKKFEGIQPASYPFKFSKDSLPQILLGPFLNTLSQAEASYGTNIIFTASLLLRKPSQILKMFQDMDFS